jgi:hypothetical protein
VFIRGLGLIVTLIAASWGYAGVSTASPLGGPVEAGCVVDVALAPITIDVPANGTATFGIADLLGESPDVMACLEMAAIDASSFVAHAGEGSVSVMPGGMLPVAGWSSVSLAEAGQQFMFTARPGFNGVSQGWEFVIHGRDASGERIVLGIVRATFQVRNVVPVAANDAVTVAPGAGAFCVGAEGGLLANDTDANNDAMVVYSDGITAFPWGLVDIHADGSYRVMVTDATVTGSHQVSYLVWDQRDSTTSADRGILTLTFDEDAVASHQQLFASTTSGGCGAA